MTTTAPLPADYVRFIDGIHTVCDIDLRHYRPGQMERRLRTFAERSGHADLDAYLAAIRRDQTARAEFLDRMTINVSELFRTPERFVQLEKEYLPQLAATSTRGLKVWSAACSYGAEPYSLAILVNELYPKARHEVRGADLDANVLARAREGIFNRADMRNVTAERRARWFTDTDDGGARVSEELRRAVKFEQMDLLKDRYPTNQDLILCRNVVIYFTAEAKRLIYDRLRAALRPGGILMVGSTESIADAEENGWEKAGTFFYRRP